MAVEPHFSPELFSFLRDLARNNRREWFAVQKQRYEDVAKGPAQRFIADVGSHLARVSPSFLADPRPVGGSMFRIYRDTRFGKDKTPYKTHVGIQFRHKARKDVHAPGFYLHLDPGRCFIAAGIWHPDTETLAQIREAIDSDPRGWKRARDDRRFRARYELSGDSLARAPHGYDPGHPLVDDLKRKDFIATTPVTEREVTSAKFPERFVAICSQAAPFVRFLCRAIDVPY